MLKYAALKDSSPAELIQAGGVAVDTVRLNGATTQVTYVANGPKADNGAVTLKPEPTSVARAESVAKSAIKPLTHQPVAARTKKGMQAAAAPVAKIDSVRQRNEMQMQRYGLRRSLGLYRRNSPAPLKQPAPQMKAQAKPQMNLSREMAMKVAPQKTMSANELRIAPVAAKMLRRSASMALRSVAAAIEPASAVMEVAGGILNAIRPQPKAARRRPMQYGMA
jgi:hypothetical protein